MTDPQPVGFAIDLPNGQTLRVHPESEAYKRCGVSFNPGEDVSVSRLKMLVAALMQEMENVNAHLDPRQDVHGVRSVADAKTMLEYAQMMAVKAIFVDGR